MRQDTFYATSSHDLNMSVAKVGKIADNRGMRNPLRWFISFFLAVSDTRLPTTERS